MLVLSTSTTLLTLMIVTHIMDKWYDFGTIYKCYLVVDDANHLQRQII
jgi:hypothetical protein